MRSRLLVCKIGLPALFIAMLLVACENDINKIKALAAADSTKPIQQTTDIDLIYSDSALVKFRLNAPLMIEYMIAKPYKVLPKGIRITFLDKDAKPAGTITADSALTRNDDKFIEFHHNVVATNAEGTVYKSEELIWDMAFKQIYSNKQVEMTKVGGDIMRGTSFKSDDALKHPIFQNATGTIHVNGDGLSQ
ncbi:LPS export ABC transporter periplasmic protein LptC [Mucilaginibacter psychrotolerans]|uniref:LPS export ABC transporter periplasmic protein LptC n=1 Tax=Mucilaginibacter psychrotolerans TaxID=1524096 RepID=A0A4Y8SIY4_9SPHI|nr:LPS export ABC transporter periplasmic protein LptC [Mucilaginibacter psychrotolerans]TFF38424.1 LPS export ABC transporter periplasmic protein LptC [Mucilaginibacter psychrotolerans]